MELPLALRRETRTNAGKPPVLYGYEHDIANGVSDSYVSPAHKAFIASLQSVSIPKDWKAAKLDLWFGCFSSPDFLIQILFH